MRINELESKCGLDRTTIRFYEKEGMIEPLRHENGYRDYSQEDLQTLTKIKLLRQLGMPLDKIRQLQQGSGDLQAAINAQMPKLTELRDQAQRALQVCQQMQSDGATYENLNAEYYLKQMRSIELQFPQTAKLPSREFREVIWRECHPERRFFARMTDQLLMCLAIVFIEAVLFKTGLYTVILYPFNFLSYLLIIPIEAICIHFFGATLGKYLFGIQVRSADGCRLSLRESFLRAWEVYRYGLGFGIPIWSLVRLYKSCAHYNEYEMDWDFDCEVTYSHGRSRIVSAIVTAILCVVMISSSYQCITTPPKTDSKLNVSGFSLNYNYFWQKNGNDSEWGLRSDGTFIKLRNENVTVISGPRLEFDHFSYAFSGENIQKVTYSEEYFDFGVYDCCPERAITAAMAVWSAYEDENESSVNEFRQQLESDIQAALAGWQKEMTRTYGSVRIHWAIRYEDARVEHMLIPKDTEDSKPYVQTFFEIEVIEP